MVYKFDNEKITFNDFFIKLNLIKTDKLKFSISDRVLKKINTEFNVPVLTDIHDKSEADIAAEYVDVLQIPAFLVRQTDILVAAAKTGKIINLKKGQFMSPESMFHAVKKCNAAGNEKVILCERGNIFGYNNLVVDTLNFQILKQEGNPVFFDVTHSLQQPGMLEKSTGGRGQYVYELAKAGISQNIAGLFLETHPDPNEAKCDGPCALKLSELDSFMERVIALDEFGFLKKNYTLILYLFFSYIASYLVS